MKRTLAFVWLAIWSVFSIAEGSECRVEDIAGLYESQWGQMACSARDGQLNCCYGDIQSCSKQLYLDLQPDKGELVGRWQYSNGSKGPAKFPVDGDCSLASGFWGSGTTANRGWTVGNRIGNVAGTAAVESTSAVATAPAAVPERQVSTGSTGECEPADLGLHYETNFGDLDCESTYDGMDCRFAADQVTGCEITFVFEIGRGGRSLTGMALNSGAMSLTKAWLDAFCNVTGIASGRGYSHIVKITGLREVPEAQPHRLNSASCDVDSIGKHYWSTWDFFDCTAVGDGLECCKPPSQVQTSVESYRREHGLPSLVDPERKCRNEPFKMKLGRSDDPSVLVGRLLSAEKYYPVSIPLDERCNLRGGTLVSCDASKVPTELTMRFDHLRAGSDTSPPRVQFEIAEVYLARNMKKEALPYLNIAAEKGHVDAQFELAVLLENGAGDPKVKRFRYIDQDVERATELYAQAAAAGHADAKESLQRRRAQQARFDALLASAESGDADAQFQVATFYGNGKIVDYDIEGYWVWLQRAAAQEHPAALYFVAWETYDSRDSERAARGKAMYERSAALGYSRAWVRLGSIAFYRENDEKLAKRYLGYALNSSDELAIYQAKSTLAGIEDVKAERDYQAWLNSPAGIQWHLDQAKGANQSAFQHASDAAFDVVFTQ